MFEIGGIGNHFENLIGYVVVPFLKTSNRGLNILETNKKTNVSENGGLDDHTLHCRSFYVLNCFQARNSSIIVCEILLNISFVLKALKW